MMTVLLVGLAAFLLLQGSTPAPEETSGYRPSVAGDEGLAGILGALGAAIGGLIGTVVEPGGGSALGAGVGGAAGAAAGYGGPQIVNAATDPYTAEQWESGMNDLGEGDVAGAVEHWSANLTNMLGIK